MAEVIYVTEDELRADLAEVLNKYPWFPDHPIWCHAKCEAWDIQNEHGVEARKAWLQYMDIKFLLGEDI